MNVEKLREVEKFLITEPRVFTMSEGIDVFDAEGIWEEETFIDQNNLIQVAPCGTACCMAGAAYIITHGVDGDYSDVEWGEVQREATKVLGLTFEEAERLFYLPRDQWHQDGGSWPQEFAARFDEAKTPLERVQVGVARIEHFIKTNGQE